MRRLLLVLALISFAGCFGPEEPLCAFACGDNNFCPDDYQCLPDGYCHLHGKAGDCMFADASASVSDGGDLSVPGDGGDMTAPADLTPTGQDLAGFMSFNVCVSPGAYSAQASGVAIHFGNSLGHVYSIPCAQLSLGGGASVTVNWSPATGGVEDFSTHPLTASTLGTQPNPIVTAVGNGPATINFTVPGFYAYHCANHGFNDTTGMAGVVWVTP